MKKTLASLSVLALLTAACQDDNGADYVAAVSIAENSISAIELVTNDVQVREPGVTARWNANAIGRDNLASNYSDKVQWSSDNTEVLRVAAGGLIETLRVGSATITARYGYLSDSATFSVSNAALESIVLSPESLELDECKVATITAQGRYGDGTTRNISDLDSLQWRTDDLSIATVEGISGAGAKLVARNSGAGVLTVSYDDAIEQTLNLSILDTLSSIDIEPLNVAMSVGDTSQLTANGNYSDNSTADITKASSWSTANTAQANTVAFGLDYASRGVVSAEAAGTAQVSAGCGGLSAAQASTVVVSEVSTLQSLSFTTSESPLILTTTDTDEALFLNAIYSDGSSVDVSDSATWEIIDGDDEFISIGDDTGTKGDIIFADNISTITDDKYVLVRATYEDERAQLRVEVVAP